ncbi:MAG: hypothetical protein S4CHLAM45_01360 [Chlamydiales bacterium]|nr:hypothetical protein [Chlamydiales bacterium]MCH9619456.1 hypothetical protein [Chlamydiales bacterium]MCH9622260.1 hypothetical protein [Chlamydiales bacterium]
MALGFQRPSLFTANIAAGTFPVMVIAYGISYYAQIRADKASEATF